ncbi:hypothetical protein FXO38_20506 [Capsicum annuum]|nr:hypothetical protein FXO38_20506 [Capsicum annuum]KAF3680612.1 hypothetical protein FXO37_03232 [Capsicum annuum]
MGKDQTIIKDTQSQGQGVCEKIFKALNLTSVFRYFSGNPKLKITTTDHHRSDPAKATKFKLVVPQKDQNLSFASNRVHVEYNHSEVDTEIPKSRDPPQNQDCPYDSSSNGRFSSYIDHVRSKIMSSFDDDDSASGVRRDGINDKITHYKFEIKATAIACGNQG